MYHIYVYTIYARIGIYACILVSLYMSFSKLRDLFIRIRNTSNRFLPPSEATSMIKGQCGTSKEHSTP